jgi:uncharacterized protein YmfQ (DUF2313 family)
MNTEAWLASLQALLPPGNALTREPGAKLTRLLEAIASMFSKAQQRFESLTEQSSDPLVATDMLPDWERVLALPDTCMANQTLSLQDRQRISGQRLVEEGGQSRPYFIDLAARLGEPGVTITEFRRFTCNSNCNDSLYSNGDRFFWRVNFPHPANNARFMNCNDSCDSPLQRYQPSLAECPISERKPGHTNVIFSYT